MPDMFKFELALEFLNNHPAMNCESYSFFGWNLSWGINQTCKNNYHKMLFETAEKLHVIVTNKDEKFEYFLKKYGDEEDRDYVYVPYREVYGCEWEYKKHQYNGRYSLFRYDAEMHRRYCPDSREGNHMCYTRYEGGSKYAETFEDLIIDIADEVKVDFGNFSYDSLLTDAEKENHSNCYSFVFKPVGDGLSEMLPNNDYIFVSDGKLNTRWWNWFESTEKFKKTYSWINDEDGDEGI